MLPCTFAANRYECGAITTIPGIRTISGITFFNADMTMLEQINTNMVASPILIPFIAEEVVPNVDIPPIAIRMSVLCDDSVHHLFSDYSLSFLL